MKPAPLTVHRLPLTGPDAPLPHPANPRRGDVDAIAASLGRLGQYRPIVVQISTRHILAGNHTVRAAVQLGWTDIAAVLVDVDDETAHRILLADNRTADLGSYDDQLLREILEGLDGDLAGTGYALTDLERMTAEPVVPAEPLSDLTWRVHVACRSAAEQTALMERLHGEGFSVKAVTRRK